VVLAGFGIQAGCCFEVIVKTGLSACYFFPLKTRLQSKAKRIEEYKMKCFTLSLIDDCWDVRLDYVRQFKSELVRRLEGLVFEKKKVSKH
jgi:hypothetical protein